MNTFFNANTFCIPFSHSALLAKDKFMQFRISYLLLFYQSKTFLKMSLQALQLELNKGLI